MKRFAAMHDCPVLIVRAFTPISAAISKSALGMTMNGSLPPSSRTLFLICRAAALATSLPARSLPVSVTAFTRGSSMTRAHLLGFDQQGLKHAFRETGAAKNIFNRERALRNVGGVFEQNDIARHQSGRGETEHLPERKIPRHDGENRPHRLVANKVAGGFGLCGPIFQKTFRILRIKPAAKRTHFSISSIDSAQQLSHLERHDLRELLLSRVRAMIAAPHEPFSPLRKRCSSVMIRKPSAAQVNAFQPRD